MVIIFWCGWSSERATDRSDSAIDLTPLGSNDGTTKMNAPDYLSGAQLEAGLQDVRLAPAGEAWLALIVCRPAVGELVVLERGELNSAEGLVVDNWRTRGRK